MRDEEKAATVLFSRGVTSFCDHSESVDGITLSCQAPRVDCHQKRAASDDDDDDDDDDDIWEGAKMAFPQGGLYCGLDNPEYQLCRSAR